VLGPHDRKDAEFGQVFGRGQPVEDESYTRPRTGRAQQTISQGDSSAGLIGAGTNELKRMDIEQGSVVTAMRVCRLHVQGAASCQHYCAFADDPGKYHCASHSDCRT